MALATDDVPETALPAHHDSLRDFVRLLEQRGELRRVTREVDPFLEITEISQRLMRAGGPALLFERVKGSRYPLLINTYATRRRMSWALGVNDLDEHARTIGNLVKSQPPTGLMDKIRMLPKLARVASASPRTVSHAPCQEVVETTPDLATLPIITCWPDDGGPYITLPMVITRDPDKGTRNVGCYRMQVFGPRETGMHWQLHKTGRRHMRRYKELGHKRMPVAVALGGDPILPYAATAPLPDGIDEFMFAGFLRRKSVDMVRCKTNDLEVPASADFVLEGYVDLDEPLRREGPFGDHTGYYSLADDYPVFHLTAITRRESPIYATTVVGPPPQEDAWLGKATERLFLPLLQMTFPEIIDMNLPVEGCFHNLCIVSIHKEYPHHARKICHSLWGMGQMMFAKCIIVVDDDVNVQNVAEVAWRALNNIDAKRDVFFAEGPIDVLDHASQSFGFGGKLGVDATRKWKDEGFAREWPEVLKMSPEVVQRVNALWKELGLG
ncbi:MAG TPA: menaquinone biosynthesis decarboxylase [Polyangia bacterium]|jgi:4-hydroxy-3-polyprenylbenzoate decarboxylase|nr:menaquinone biosynthesis decarboxylase [Polyangia bacterium]